MASCVWIRACALRCDGGLQRAPERAGLQVSPGMHSNSAAASSRDRLVGVGGGSVSATLGWSEKDFGELNPSVVLRQVIPSILALALGFQIVLGSFFLSVLGLESKGGEG